jgi:hypothetical protein
VSEVYRVWQLLTRSSEFHTATSSAEPPVGRHE